MKDWGADPRGNLGKYDRMFEAGKISKAERLRREAKELDWIDDHCPHKASSREYDNATFRCGDCGATLGAEPGGGGLIVVRSGPCLVIALLLGSATAGLGWGAVEAVSLLLT